MATNNQITKKGFIKDSNGNILLPITRAELILDKAGIPALHSEDFIAQLPDASQQFAGLPGLITAAEKALLHTLDGGNESGSGTIANIYAHLETLFNTSLSFNGTALKYYTDKSLNSINIKDGEGIAINVSGFDASIGLAPLADKTGDTTINNVITGITVDKFGRVTNVSGSNSLTGITLSGATITETIAELTNDKAVVSKEYVDSKFDTVNTLAVGALRFGSVLQDEDQLTNLWNKKDSYINYYYKLGFNGTLASGMVLDHTGELPFRIGDTIIVHETSQSGVQFVYIPSGDEPVTSVGVKDYNGNGYDPTIGNIALTFAKPFSVQTQQGNTVISLPTLGSDSTIDVGLLSKTDYDNFKIYSGKTISYNPTVTINSLDRYEIGKLSFGSDAGTSIYGQNTTYTLEVKNGYESGEHLTRDPKLVFTPSSQDATTIQIQGTSGIVVTHTDNTINITADNTIVDDGSRKYLAVEEGYKFKATIGKVENGTITDGLADFRNMMEYIAELHSTTAKYIEINNSLSSTDTTLEYRYRSEALVKAITLDI